MPHSATTAAAAAIPNAQPSSSRPSLRRPVQLASTGSFHAGAPLPSFSRKSFTGGVGRRQSTHIYHTFPTQPPKTPSDAPDVDGLLRNAYSDNRRDGAWKRHRRTDSRDSTGEVTPLPIRQLALLAFLSICEQTALNSIGPYLPTMVASFPEIPEGQVGLYVGLLASAFALAQLMTNFLWGYFSDRIGRKPIMLLGTALLMVCFAFFGFCRRYWQVLVVHIAMGLLNGNAAVVPTVLGEVTDRSNQSKAFTWLPVMYSLGGITGPALGGLLVGEMGGSKYPFLAPNLLAAVLLGSAVVVLAIWFRETLDEHEIRPLHWPTTLSWARRICPGSCFGREKGKQGSWNAQWLNPRRGSGPWERSDGVQNGGFDEQGDAGEEQALLDDTHDQHVADNSADDNKASRPSSRRTTLRQLLNWTTISILVTYLIFQVANISFNSLYPIFASAEPPTGRDLHPGTIGVSMSLAGVVTILFQVSLFEPIKARLGNLGTFKLSLLGLALCMILMPWVGYQSGNGLMGWGSGRAWLLGELGVILVLKNLSAVGGLSCVLLLVRFHPSRVGLCLFFFLNVRTNGHFTDNEFCALARDPRHPQRHRADSFRSRPQLRALCVRRPVHAVDAHPAQRRAPCVGPFWRRSAARMGDDAFDPRREPGER